MSVMVDKQFGGAGCCCCMNARGLAADVAQFVRANPWVVAAPLAVGTAAYFGASGNQQAEVPPAPQPLPSSDEIPRSESSYPSQPLASEPVASQPPASQPLPEPVAVPATPAPVTPPQFRNPVLANDAPDPSVIRAEDGTFYAATTQAMYWPMIWNNTPIVKSTDLVNWKYVGDAFPNKPDWVKGDMWAPHITKTGDHYTMFYSGRKHDDHMAVGYATASSPEGPWNDRGILISSSSWGYEIDPYLLRDGDRNILYWGSGPEGITAQEVSIGPDGAISPIGDRRIIMPGSGGDSYEKTLVEGPWVEKRGEWYYLMYSAGSWQDNYAVKAARSKDPLGPFEKKDQPILESNDGWWEPGHHSVISDDAGQDWMVYHAFVPNQASAGRQMLVDRIEWKDGWPVVNNGNGPSSGPMNAPIIDAVRGAS